LALHRLTPAFRSWGNRQANGYQALAEDGYFLLAERLRSADERAVVRSVLERVMRVRLDLDAIYASDAASAREMLQTAALENADHGFSVRNPLCLLPLWMQICSCTPSAALRRRRCDTRVPNTSCGDSPK